MMLCDRCARPLRASEVVRVDVPCPYCDMEVTVRLCLDCARTIKRALEVQIDTLVMLKSRSIKS